MKRRRTSSYFNVHDYEDLRKERQQELDRKGRFAVTHSEMPDRPDSSNSSSLPGFYHERIRNKKALQNTFKLDPDKRFDSSVVSSIVTEELKSLEHVNYDPRTARKLAIDLSNRTKTQITRLGFLRYKIIALVTIGAKQQQGVEMASRFFLG